MPRSKKPRVCPVWSPLPLRPWVLEFCDSIGYGTGQTVQTKDYRGIMRPVRFHTSEDAIAYGERHGYRFVICGSEIES